MLTRTEAIALLERAVQEKGENYWDPNAEENGCQYVNGDGQAGCIVGHVFAYLDWLRYIDYEANTEPVDKVAGYGFFPHMDEDAVRVLRAAQEKQDAGDSWGEALDAAKAV